jgi:hypothetical protein
LHNAVAAFFKAEPVIQADTPAPKTRHVGECHNQWRAEVCRSQVVGGRVSLLYMT